jgi:hypothetical protein
MAIKKVKLVMGDQVQIEHHTIAAIPTIVNTPETQVLTLTVYEYLNAQSKSDGKTPISLSTYTIEISRSEITGLENILALLYTKLSALSDFDGCEPA